MSCAMLNLPGGASLPLDEKGYLLDWRVWTPEVAQVMAAADGVELGDDHWLVLGLFREYFERYEIEPPMRALVRLVRERLGEERGNSRYLYRLFPAGPGTQACRYAGLPRPVSCI
ncbi:MAG: TusE/DsrC/DsvC family sulfur relay protein [Xanthomonadales bacterium]|jgi:tRNA 2-thiouridine synthesizing protein E|nr:TusE/DsrC/DsvC family sulfur relay protein [Xanthomonadales bacterium]